MKRRVSALVSDMIFTAKIRTTAELLGVDIDFARTADRLVEAAQQHRYDLIIIDLHFERDDPFALAAHLKTYTQLREIPIIGFYSHVQVELRRQAEESGVDHVLPRSAFVKKLPEILKGEL